MIVLPWFKLMPLLLVVVVIAVVLLFSVFRFVFHRPHASSVETAAESVLQPFYPRLHAAGLPADSIPSGLALGFTPYGRRSAQEEGVRKNWAAVLL